MDELWQQQIEEQVKMAIKEAERDYEESLKSSSIEAILEERKYTHGEFVDVSATSQMLKNVVKNTGKNYEELSMAKKEAIDNILQKISRLVNGNSNHKDSWEDIAGYATLISKELE